MCPMIGLRESRFCGKMESWDQITQSSFSETTMRHTKIREKKGPSQGTHSKVRTSGAKSIGLPNSRKERKTNKTLNQERCVRRDAWESVKGVCKLKKGVKKTHSTLLPKFWVVPAPSSTKPEARHFVIDSGASRNM